MNILIFLSFIAISIIGARGNCNDTRESCLFCAINPEQPRFFRYTDRFLNHAHTCRITPQYCTYDCERIYHRGSGSVLDPERCVCTQPDPDYRPKNPRVCQLLDINPETVDKGKTRDNLKLISDKGAFTVSGNQMCFEGLSGYVEIPFFKSNDMGFKFNLKMRFRPLRNFESMKDKEEMVLWNHGCANEDPSLQVAVNRTGVIVRATGADNKTTTLYCQPKVTDEEKRKGMANFLAPPLMNKIRVVYNGGKDFDSNGDRKFGLIGVTVNDGSFTNTLSATCSVTKLGPSHLRPSACPVLIPGKNFNGCLSKIELERSCDNDELEGKKIF